VVQAMKQCSLRSGRARGLFRIGSLAAFALAGATLPGQPAAGSTFHVSPEGSDAAAGDELHPFRTVQRAAEAAQPGDVVLVSPGVYRERVAPPRGGEAARPIVFRSQVRHAAVLKGSDVWEPTWESHGEQIWSGVVAENLFTDTTHVDGANPFAIPLASTPWGREGFPEHERHRRGERGGNPAADPTIVYTLGQVFVDGVMYRQVPIRAELDDAAGTWFYDSSAHRLYLRFPAGGPQGHVVELTTRRRIFAPHDRGLGHIQVEGFVMEHCGNQYPTDFWVQACPQWQQAGALGTRGGHHWTIRDNVVRLAQGVGLDLGVEGHPDADLELGGRKRPPSAGHHVVEDNVIAHNGGAGTAGYMARGVVLRRNVVVGNNLLRFYGKKRWESGGIKLHSPHESLIEANVIVDNHSCAGLWFDQGAGNRTRIEANVIIGHHTGLDVEIGRGRDAVATRNVIVDNGVGIAFRESGGVRVVDNLIVSMTGTAVKNAHDPKRPGDWTSGPIDLFGNIIAGTTLVSVVPPGQSRSEARRFDGNAYAVVGDDDHPFAVAGTGRLAFSEWQQYWHDHNGGQDCDRRSIVATGFAYSLDRVSGMLAVKPGFDPAALRRASGIADAGEAGPCERLGAGGGNLRLWAEDVVVGLPEPWAVTPGLTASAGGPIVGPGATQ